MKRHDRALRVVLRNLTSDLDLTRSAMPDPLLANAGSGEDIVPTTPTSNHHPLLQLPTELLVEIIVALNKNYPKKPPRGSHPLLALRL